MKNVIILGADIGKFDTKLLGKNFTVEESELLDVNFRTKSYDLEKGFLEKQGNSYNVTLDSKEYIVGEQGDTKSLDTSKTTYLHKLCAYTGISKMIEPGIENDVYLVLACPVSVLKSAEAKEEYKNFIKSNGEVEIIVDNKEYKFAIKDITIKAESSGILYTNPELFKNKNVLVVDLGGLNLTACLYINGVCKNEDRWVEECGVNRLTEIVREEAITYKKGNLISYEQSEQALNRGHLLDCGTVDLNSTKVIEHAKEIYLDEVLGFIKSHKVNINELDEIVFVGGTINKVQKQIKEVIPHSYIPEEPEKSTLKGLYKIAFNKYRSKVK